MTITPTHHAPAIVQRPAFTLLETLLAITILSVLMGFVAVLWGQARTWTEDSHKEQSAMHVTRILHTMRTQWRDRRATDLGRSALDATGMTPDEVRFVTATAILFPDWPLVRATYRIEYDPGRGTLSDPRYRLVYSETRLPGGQPDPLGSLDAVGMQMTQSIVLLEDCSVLHWERFGLARADQSRRSRDGENEDGSQRSEGLRREDSPRGDTWEWRIYTEQFEDRIPAVRLVGQYGKEHFACVLVAVPLR